MDKLYNEFYNEFLEILKKGDKQSCIKLVLEKLDNNEIDIPTLYTKILTPALNSINSNTEGDTHVCIWKEHILTSIVKTIIECCYPYILKEIENDNYSPIAKKVIVLCPPEEYHDLGAKMASDFFTLCGYHSIFIGANTPKNDFIDAISHIKPDYVAISITNYYSIISVKAIIEEIKNKASKKITILVGGNVFKSNSKVFKELGADFLIYHIEDIKALDKGGQNYESTF